MPAIKEDKIIQLRSHGVLEHKKTNLKELLVLVPYVRLAVQQHHSIFNSDDQKNWMMCIK